MLRDLFSRVGALQRLSLVQIVAELNATLRRKEEARIYHWHQTEGRMPPPRTGTRDQGGTARRDEVATPGP